MRLCRPSRAGSPLARTVAPRPFGMIEFGRTDRGSPCPALASGHEKFQTGGIFGGNCPAGARKSGLVCLPPGCRVDQLRDSSAYLLGVISSVGLIEYSQCALVVVESFDLSP